MQLSQSTSMRQEMRQLLTPRVIQSMEILALHLMELEERIEEELQNNPVLEVREPENDPATAPTDAEPQNGHDEFSEGEQVLVVKENSNQSEVSDRLTRISEYFENE